MYYLYLIKALYRTILRGGGPSKYYAFGYLQGSPGDIDLVAIKQNLGPEKPDAFLLVSQKQKKKPSMFWFAFPSSPLKPIVFGQAEEKTQSNLLFFERQTYTLYLYLCLVINYLCDLTAIIHMNMMQPGPIIL